MRVRRSSRRARRGGGSVPDEQQRQAGQAGGVEDPEQGDLRRLAQRCDVVDGQQGAGAAR